MKRKKQVAAKFAGHYSGAGDDTYRCSEMIGRAAEDPAVKCVLSAAAAFILTGARLGGTHSPLCVPFVSVLDPISCAAGTAGVILSCLVHGSFADNLTETAAAAAVMIIRALIGKRFSPRYSPALAACAYAVCGAAIGFYSGIDKMTAAALAFRTLLCLAAGYIFSRASYLPLGGRYHSDPVPFVISGVLLLSALCGVQLWYVNIGRMLSCALCALYASKHGCRGGAAAGTACACAMVLSDGVFGRSAALAACAAFASGLASGKGKPAVCVTYIFSSLTLAVTVGLPAGVTEYIADSALGGLICFFVPAWLILPSFDVPDREGSGETRHTAARLGFTADIFEGIRQDAERARSIMLKKESLYSAADAVCEGMCTSCDRLQECTAVRNRESFVHSVELVGSFGHIDSEILPNGLDGCLRKSELISCFNGEYAAAGRRRTAVKTADGISAALSGQLAAQGCMLRSISANTGTYFDRRLSVIAGDALRALGMTVRSACVYYDSDGRAYSEVFIAAGFDGDYSRATERMSVIAGRALDDPVVTRAGDVYRLRWCELPVFAVDIGTASSAGTDEISGDNSEHFPDGRGKIYFIISDGMGSGTRAAEESCMAVSVVKRMLLSGAGIAAAVGYADVLLSGISSDEMFTTLDIAELDVFTGKCTIYKLGAPESYVRSGNEVITVQGGAFPIGILHGARPLPYSVTLADGDAVVMVSDGALTNGGEYITGLIMSDNMTAQLCADRIAAKSTEQSRQDDRTALVFRLYA